MADGRRKMAQLFGIGVPAISKHLSHIFEEGELNKDATVSKMKIITQHENSWFVRRFK